MSNPFKVGSTSYHDFEVMSDLEWHCTKCELKSGQAKTWQVWRQSGISLAKDDKGNFYKKIYCSECDNKTVHRKLLTLKISEDTKSRAGLPSNLAKKVKNIYKNEEAMLLRELPTRELEVDHRFPQIRWNSDEEKNDISMSEQEIRQKFILLNRSNNLLESRYCEKCVATGIRGNFPGIYYWYKGEKEWDSTISSHDEKGCVGCFWYDPYTWREELNKMLDNNIVKGEK